MTVIPDIKTRREAAESEVARLTEALAAVERDAARNKSWEPLHDAEQERAEAAERDRDAANALLRRCRDGFDWNQYDDTEQNQIGRDLEAHLSGQPAAPATTATEARVRELEASLSAANSTLDRWREGKNDAAELAALRERVARAMEKANGRWCEWGDRAESVRDALEEAFRGR